MTTTYTPSTWDRDDAQAALDGGDPVILEPGKYSLGDGIMGLDLKKTDAHLEARGKAVLQYDGAGVGVRLGRGSSGVLRGVHVRGTAARAGRGIEVDASAIRMAQVETTHMATGIFYRSGQVSRLTDARILACDVGIDFDPAQAQNQIAIDDVMFRSNGVHVVCRKGRNVRFGFCDFEAASSNAVILHSTGGGSIQGISFDQCWFEANNLDASPEDDAAEVEIVSQNGLSVRSVSFDGCFWGLVGGQAGSSRKSRYHIRIGSADVGDVAFHRNFPKDITEIPGTPGFVVDYLQ